MLSRCIGRTKGGLNSKLHVVCNESGKPLVMLLTDGQMNDHKGARLMLKALPPASAAIADHGYDSDWFRQALLDQGTQPCIPPTKSRKQPLDYDKALYRQRHKVENLFAKLKDWRRIATCYDRCAHTSSQPSASQPPLFSTSINEPEPAQGVCDFSHAQVTIVSALREPQEPAC